MAMDVIQIVKQKSDGFAITLTQEAFLPAIQTAEMELEKDLNSVMIMILIMGTGAPRLAKLKLAGLVILQ